MKNHQCTRRTHSPRFPNPGGTCACSLTSREQRGPRVSDAVAAGERTRLVAAALDGDQAAWESIIELHHKLVWWMLGSYSFDHATQEDIYQTVWFRLAENLDKIRDAEQLPAWLATTTRNEALKRVRYERRVRPTDLSDFDLIDLRSSPEDEVEINEERRDVIAAFGRLDEACRELLVLCTTEPPLGYEEIAELWGRPIGSIGPTRSRCLDQLRKLMS